VPDLHRLTRAAWDSAAAWSGEKEPWHTISRAAARVGAVSG
jgi:hypothetical protein